MFFYRFQCGLCNESYHGECVRHLNVRTGENVGILPCTKTPSSVGDHSLFCNHSASYDNFNFFNNNLASASLDLFKGPSNKIFARILFVLIVTTLFLLK